MLISANTVGPGGHQLSDVVLKLAKSHLSCMYPAHLHYGLLVGLLLLTQVLYHQQTLQELQLKVEPLFLLRRSLTF